MMLLHIVALMTIGLLDTSVSPDPKSIEAEVKAADDAFWAAFNACDQARMTTALAPDIEFYHDKTGATTSRTAVVKSLMDGPCGTPGLHVRRELVAGSVNFDPIPGFGAMLTGRHRFYARGAGGGERLDGEARFAVVWQDQRGKLVMRRILSYAHGSALDPIATQTIDVPLATLQRYVGHYASPVGDIVVILKDGRLHLTSGGLSTDLAPVGMTVFQATGRPLRFEFIVAENKAEKILVRENDVTVVEAARRDGR